MTLVDYSNMSHVINKICHTDRYVVQQTTYDDVLAATDVSIVNN